MVTKIKELREKIQNIQIDLDSENDLFAKSQSLTEEDLESDDESPNKKRTVSLR